MNPIASDLLISVLRTEAELAHRQAATRIPATFPNPVHGLRAVARFVHQLVDPRGFALAEALKMSPKPKAVPAPRIAPVTPVAPARTVPVVVPGDALPEAA